MQETEYQYNPEGVMSRVHRNKAIFLAGPTAMQMQLALPQVADAIKVYGFFEDHPVERLKQTADAGVKLIFQTPGSEEIADRINGIHAGIHGVLTEAIGAYPAGTHYSATYPELLTWVGATLAYGSIVGYETFVSPLSEAEKDQYMQESQAFFTLFGVPHDNLPSTFQGLRGYVTEMIATQHVIVSKTAQELAPYTTLSQGAPPRYKVPSRLLRLVTKNLLPNKLREQFGYILSDAERKSMRNLAAESRLAQRVIPRKIREIPQYRQAQENFAQKIV